MERAKKKNKEQFKMLHIFFLSAVIHHRPQQREKSSIASSDFTFDDVCKQGSTLLWDLVQEDTAVSFKIFHLYVFSLFLYVFRNTFLFFDSHKTIFSFPTNSICYQKAWQQRLKKHYTHLCVSPRTAASRQSSLRPASITWPNTGKGYR